MIKHLQEKLPSYLSLLEAFYFASISEMLFSQVSFKSELWIKY